MKKSTLEDILIFRENRARRRAELLELYPVSLACLGLNIPGEYKDFPWARRSFHEQIDTFTLALEAESMAVLHKEQEEGNSGYSAYISVAAPPDKLKTLALRLEKNHPLGRLFDIDIYNSGGQKLSREDSGIAPRPCLVCGGNGFLCGRSRAHAPEELEASVRGIMENWLRQKIGDTVSSAALWAMMSEAAVTPKPGLVDRAHSGAHKDMDFFTFIDSASALFPWFRSCALAGFDSGEDPISLFEALRPPGRMAEVLMRRAAGGANTHRGYIFSLGILSAAYGKLCRDNENPNLSSVLEFSKAMTKELWKDFSPSAAAEGRPGDVSHGEAVYERTGIKGIREEVSRGFPSVTEHALPLLRGMLKEGFSLNDAGTAVLLKLLAHAEDTNIIYRGGRAAFDAIRRDLLAFFAENPGIDAIREKAVALDQDFIAGNLSPGGSADLLGIAFFLFRLLEDGEAIAVPASI